MHPTVQTVLKAWDYMHTFGGFRSKLPITAYAGNKQWKGKNNGPQNSIDCWTSTQNSIDVSSSRVPRNDECTNATSLNDRNGTLYLPSKSSCLEQ
jgi:hypothetical protein